MINIIHIKDLKKTISYLAEKEIDLKDITIREPYERLDNYVYIRGIIIQDEILKKEDRENILRVISSLEYIANEELTERAYGFR